MIEPLKRPTLGGQATKIHRIADFLGAALSALLRKENQSFSVLIPKNGIAV